MSVICGIDPGAHGAFAFYDNVTHRLAAPCVDMPTWMQQIGKTKRLRVDPIAIAEIFDMFPLLGVELIVLEAVGGYGKQPGNSAFTFGKGVGMIHMAAVYSRLPLDTVAPAAWKKELNVPGKAKADDSAIMQRAHELFPQDHTQFYGPRGGKMVDRAEASMLAKYGGDILWRNLRDAVDVETMVRNADTGG